MPKLPGASRAAVDLVAFLVTPALGDKASPATRAAPAALSLPLTHKERRKMPLDACHRFNY
jgi:hypothetical protein